MDTSKYHHHLIISVLAVIFVATACEVNDNGNQETQGQFRVQLTDAPAPYDAVNIDIDQVQIKETVNENSDEEGWITLNDESRQVDLLDLRNGNTIRIGDEDLQAGTYHQIRLILGADNNVVINGEKFSLKTPSARQSGLKLNINAEVKAGEIYTLLIDFDASQSIVSTGSSKYILKPVLHAVNLEETASIFGIVEPANGQTSVMTIARSDTLSTLTNNDGSFQIQGAADGTYSVVFEPGGTIYADTTLTGITVQNHEDVDLGTIALPNK